MSPYRQLAPNYFRCPTSHLLMIKDEIVNVILIIYF